MTDPDTTRQDRTLAEEVAQTALDILQDVGPKYWILSDGVQSRVTWEGPDEITLEHTETGHAASFVLDLRVRPSGVGPIPEVAWAPVGTERTPADLILRVVELARAELARSGFASVLPGPIQDLAMAFSNLDEALAREAQEYGTGHWEPSTWGIVKDGDRVRLNGAEATVTTAVRLNWHTDPASPRWTKPLESATVQVVLEGKNDGHPYTMPPSGPVEVWRESLPDWAAQAFVTLAEGGAGP